ncbi:secretory phospholipase A2 receptor-like [Anticarsia gemmatalis]|uniref:secretory phospholipase A2 receptor-like n=1 Tax=Anticarsia gemmatalis TaxID=129554 RepID=UPI003F774F33
MKLNFVYVVLIVCAVAIDGVICVYQYDKEANIWFNYHKLPVTWFRARRICALEGGVLGSPTTTQLTRLMSSYGRMFTGIHATNSEGLFYTIEGQSLDEIPHEWLPGEPNNVKNLEHCIVTSVIEKLADFNCEEPLPYMCFKREMKPLTACGTSDEAYTFHNATNKCYKAHEAPANFSDASFVCSGEGGHLVIINSEAEAGVIRDIFNKHQVLRLHGLAYVGYQTWGSLSEMKTIHGETLKQAGYDKFYFYSPAKLAGTEQFCGAANHQAVFSYMECNYLKPFICEMTPPQLEKPNYHQLFGHGDIITMKSNLKYLVLIFCFAFIEGKGSGYKFSGHNKIWYKYHNIPATWFVARRTCAIEGGVLASPVSSWAQRLMQASAPKHFGIFTGIHDTYSNGFYYTVHGTPLEGFPHEWAANEPNNIDNAEHCLAMNSEGRLSDVSCDKPRPYLCLKTHRPENECGTSDSEYVPYKETNKCYKFHKKPENFTEANFVCSAEGGHLAIINSEIEAGVIRKIISKYPENKVVGEFWKKIVFVGFHNWGTGGDWRTIHGQTLKEAGYDKFATKEPKMPHGAEAYCGAVFRDGTLDDTHCTNLLSFICEKERSVIVHQVEKIQPGSSLE